jgi:hypothetical protein
MITLNRQLQHCRSRVVQGHGIRVTTFEFFHSTNKNIININNNNCAKHLTVVPQPFRFDPYHRYEQYDGLKKLRCSKRQLSGTGDDKKSATEGLPRKLRSWDQSFQLLVDYKEQNGHCNVPHGYKLDPILGRWVSQQRTIKDSLSDNQCAKLADLGFSWSIHRAWEENFKLLVDYKEQHGHCNVPQKYEQDPVLGLWVVNQRQRKDSLSAEQLSKLDDLGFSWSILRTWNENFELLVSYKEQYGHCNVPTIYSHDPILGRWVITQRQRKDSLSDNQCAKLDDLGFSWSILRSWNENFDIRNSTDTAMFQQSTRMIPFLVDGY